MKYPTNEPFKTTIESVTTNGYRVVAAMVVAVIIVFWCSMASETQYNGLYLGGTSIFNWLTILNLLMGLSVGILMSFGFWLFRKTSSPEYTGMDLMLAPLLGWIWVIALFMEELCGFAFIVFDRSCNLTLLVRRPPGSCSTRKKDDVYETILMMAKEDPGIERKFNQLKKDVQNLINSGACDHKYHI